MTEIVLYDSVEAFLVGYLPPLLAARGTPTDVSTKFPREGATRHVLVSTAGGSERALVLTDRLVIVQCYAASDPLASRLAELTYALVKATPRDGSQSFVRRVGTVGLPAKFPDPDSGLARYQFTVSLTIRGDVI